MADETITRKVSDVTDERLISIPRAGAPYVWKGDFAVFNGPFVEAQTTIAILPARRATGDLQ